MEREGRRCLHTGAGLKQDTMKVGETDNGKPLKECFIGSKASLFIGAALIEGYFYNPTGPQGLS